MKIFDLDSRYRLLQRFGHLARFVGRRAEVTKQPGGNLADTGCLIHARRIQIPGSDQKETQVFLLPRVFNRLYTDRLTADSLHGEDLCNVELWSSATTPGKVASAKWFDKITAAGSLTALGDMATFVGASGTGGVAGANFDATLPRWSSSHITSKLSSFGAAGSPGLRYVFFVLASKTSFRKNGDFFTPLPLVVSTADVNGKFQVLFGDWLASGSFSGTPRATNFAGLSITNEDLGKIAKDENGGVVFDLDDPPKLADGSADPSYVGARFFGVLAGTDPLGNPVTITGEAVGSTLREFGDFPSPWPSQGGHLLHKSSDPDPVGTTYWRVYNPDGRISGASPSGLDFFGLNPYSRSYFTRRGEVTGGSTTSWTYEMKAVTTDATGSVIVSDISLPGALASNADTTSIGVTTDYSNSGWSCDYVFFDGTHFRKLGSGVQTGSSLSVGTGGSTASDGSFTVSSCLPQTADSGAHGTGNWNQFGWYMSEYDVLFAPISFLTPTTPAVIHGSAFSTTPYSYTDTSVLPQNTGGSGATIIPNLADGLNFRGAAWGGYDTTGDGSDSETGFMEASITNEWHGGQASRIATMTVCAPPNGVVWYRPGAASGLFVYTVNSGVDNTAWEADRQKYRDIYYGKIPTTDPTYENPEVVLTRIMAAITVVLNNFVSPAMVAFLGTIGLPQVML